LLPIGLCIPFLKAETPAGSAEDPEVTIGTMLRRAFGHSSYVLLTLGFFVCGFHVAFMTAHLPVYVAEVCGSVTLGGQEGDVKAADEEPQREQHIGRVGERAGDHGGDRLGRLGAGGRAGA
ncbi:MAG: hypothetical protein AAFW46_19555, partial [Pseudomonadota bacterium]